MKITTAIASKHLKCQLKSKSNNLFLFKLKGWSYYLFWRQFEIAKTFKKSNVVVDKSTDNAKPHSICLFTTISMSKKMFLRAENGTS